MEGTPHLPQWPGSPWIWEVDVGNFDIACLLLVCMSLAPDINHSQCVSVCMQVSPHSAADILGKIYPLIQY